MVGWLVEAGRPERGLSEGLFVIIFWFYKSLFTRYQGRSLY